MQINMIGPYNETGYGVHFSNLLKALVALPEVDVTWFNIGPVTADPPVSTGKCYYQVKDWDPSAPSIRLFHEFDMALFPGYEPIAYPVFELDAIRQDAVHQLAKCNMIMVPSAWAKDVILSVPALQDMDVYVVPEGVSDDFFSVGEPINFFPNDDVFRFLHIGKYETRKNQDLIYDAYMKAFGGRKDVELVFMIDNLWDQEGTQRFKQRAYAGKGRITFLPRVNKQTLIALIHEVQAGVFASRAEGWNLPLLEMMAAGKPVITTSNTGMTEFVTSLNAWIIDSGPLIPAMDNKFFVGEGRWYDPGCKQLAEFMHSMFLHGRDGIEHNQSGIDTAKQFSWTNAAKTLLGAFGAGPDA